MIASLTEQLFSAVEDTTLALLGIFEVCVDRRHLLLTRPIWDRSSVIRAWLDRLPRRTRAEIEDVLRHGIDASAQAAPSVRRIRSRTSTSASSAGSGCKGGGRRRQTRPSAVA